MPDSPAVNSSTPTSRKSFRWQGITADGSRVQGQQSATDEADLRRQLTQKNITPLTIEAVRQSMQWRRPTLRDVALFSRQLSALIQAEIPMVTALQTLAQGGTVPRLRNVINDLSQQVNAGSALSEAMTDHSQLFDHLYISMVKAGEKSGQLTETLIRLSSYLEQQVELRAEIRNALMYPVIVSLVAIGIAAVMLTVIVPMFADVFKDFGAELPVYTQQLINLSNWLNEHGLWLLLGCGVVFLSFALLVRRSASLKAWLAQRVLGIPGLGLALEQAALARFTATVSTLYKGGIPLPDTLQLAAGATGNAWYQRQILAAVAIVQQGGTLSSALERNPRFDSTTIEMTRIGEDTGRLSELYEHLTSYYNQESRSRIDAAKRLVEPLMILFIGGLIAGLVLALYLPIITLVTTI